MPTMEGIKEIIFYLYRGNEEGGNITLAILDYGDNRRSPLSLSRYDGRRSTREISKWALTSKGIIVQEKKAN